MKRAPACARLGFDGAGIGDWPANEVLYNGTVWDIGGQEEGFRAAYQRHAAEILRYAYRCTGRREIAEELANEAFMKLYEHRREIDFARAGAWLTTAVKNLATDYWRRQQVERKSASLAEAPAAAGFPETRWEDLIGHPSLKAEHRVCLTLHYVHGMANKEIAGHTGLTDNQVKNALQYGLRLLRTAFGIAREETR